MQTRLHGLFRLLPGSAAALLVGCSGPSDTTQLTAEGTASVPSLDDVAERARVPGPDGHGDEYLLEGDMLTDYDGVVRYYERRFLEPVDKAVGERITVAGNIVFDRRQRPTVNYCLTGGWGGSFPTEAQVNTDLRGAMRDWERVANLYFVHVTALDGAACVEARVTDGSVHFIVTQNSGAGSSAGLPGAAVASQKLKIGTGGIAPGGMTSFIFFIMYAMCLGLFSSR